MSGGHYNYATMPGFGLLSAMYEDEETQDMVPELCEILEKLDAIICEAAKALDYHISCDSRLDDVGRFEKRMIIKMREVFPPDEADIYKAVDDVVAKAKRLDDFHELKLSAERAFGKMSSVLEQGLMSDKQRLAWLYRLKMVAVKGASFHEGAFAPEILGVPLLEAWQVKAIDEKIDEIQQLSSNHPNAENQALTR